MSTDSLPDYLQRSRSDAGHYPHHALSAETRGGPELAKAKRALTPPLSPLPDNISGNFARKKFHRSENSSLSTSVEQHSLEESPKLATHGVSPSRQSDSSYHSPDNEHIAKKKRAMYQVLL